MLWMEQKERTVAKRKDEPGRVKVIRDDGITLTEQVSSSCREEAETCMRAASTELWDFQHLDAAPGSQVKAGTLSAHAHTRHAQISHFQGQISA